MNKLQREKKIMKKIKIKIINHINNL